MKFADDTPEFVPICERLLHLGFVNLPYAAWSFESLKDDKTGVIITSWRAYGRKAFETYLLNGKMTAKADPRFIASHCNPPAHFNAAQFDADLADDDE